jgi:ubiquinone/menaquinone biosynthesis C-methylase UbiE
LLVVDESVDELERLRHASAAPNVFYLIGTVEVLPLTDSSVDEVIATGGIRPEAAGEWFRVLRSGGRLVLDAPDEEPTGQALNLDPRELERLFTDTGFASVSVAADGGRVAILARKP